MHLFINIGFIIRFTFFDNRLKYFYKHCFFCRLESSFFFKASSSFIYRYVHSIKFTLYIYFSKDAFVANFVARQQTYKIYIQYYG